MATVNKVRGHKNTELRGVEVAVGEIDTITDSPNATDTYQITVLPKGAVLGRVVVKQTSGTTMDVTVATCGKTKAITANPAGVETEEFQGVVVPAGGAVVTAKLSTALEYGTLEVAVEMFMLDRPMGSRVAYPDEV